MTRRATSLPQPETGTPATTQRANNTRTFLSAAPLLAVWALIGGLALACGDAPTTSDAPASTLSDSADPSSIPGPVFVDLPPSAGLDFVHQNGACGRLYLAEMMGSGAALFDYDNDGDLDAYLVQGGLLDPDPACQPERWSGNPGPEPMDRLYRNDLEVGSQGARLGFTDVTRSSGIVATGYGMGVATGDFDNDGWVDLYVTNLGSNQLLRNLGDGTFRDVTATAGVDDPRWSTSAAFVDFDRDGWLDLYVANYVDFAISARQQCRSLTGAPDYCGPLAYRPVPDSFFRNRGDGTFDGAWSAALAETPGAGLGVASGDFDGDGRLDLYVANDGMPNFLWVADESGRPVDRGMLSGSALNHEGQAEAGMGVAVGDIDGDGDEDLLVTHLALETNTLYRNLGSGIFEDQSAATGLGAASWSLTGFGTVWLDFDNDGRLDLAAVNGAVKILPELVTAEDPFPLRMPNLLFHNLDGSRFADVSDHAGAAFSNLEVSRGLAVGDLDNDGDPDLLLANNGGPARLLINQLGQSRPWLGLRLLNRSAAWDRLGAKVRVERPADNGLVRRVRTDGSYLAASDPRVLFGLGDTSVENADILVLWPGGATAWERFSVPIRTYSDLVEGKGTLVDGVD